MNTDNSNNTLVVETSEAIAQAQSAASNNAIALGEKMRAELAKLGETLGEFKAYDSANVPVEIAGTRITKCLYRADNTSGLVSSYVRLPIAHLASDLISVALPDLQDHILNWLESVEDKKIKSAHAKGQLNIFTSGLSIASIIDYLEETTEGGRLNKDKISAWFTSAFEAPLSLVVASKLGIDIEHANESELLKVMAVVKAYQIKFEVFASPKASIKTEDMEAMRKAIILCSLEQDSLALRFIARMNKIESDNKDALFAL